MESELKHNELVDLLKWQLELGVTETMNEAPVNRYQALNQEVDTQLEVSSLNSDSTVSYTHLTLPTKA